MLFAAVTRASAVLGLLLAASPAAACPGIDHEHGLAPRSARVSTQPSGGTRLLRAHTWGNLQILHTTDIHGWYQGHQKASQPEPNYSGDWGDFASFVTHMRRQAKRRGVDLLLVDSGDLHDGAGLSDGFPAGQGPDAHVSNQFHSLVEYDLLSVGNHELYVYTNALDTYKNFVPAQKGRYLASNVNISYAPAPGVANVTVPMGKRYVKFKTQHGRRITAFGVLFNFKGSDKGITVQDPAAMVKERWFLDAIKEQPDAFILVGHMPVRNDQFTDVINVIRTAHPTVPIVVAGGHSHIRDAVRYDANAVGIESGRYLETIGMLSVNLTRHGQVGNLSVSRSYIDANRRNYAFHAGLSERRLDTPLGTHITHAMTRVAENWNLTQVYGTAPQDYFLDRVAATDEASLLNLLTNKVLPTVISTSNAARAGTPNFVLLNSGSQRFDLLKGPFTKNDQYIVSPFVDAFLYLKDVPYQYASQLIHKLNNDQEAAASSRRSIGDDNHQYEAVYKRWRQEQHLNARADLEELDRRADEQATLGYVTSDDFGKDGDDTKHIAVPFQRQPDYVASPLSGNTTAATPDTLVDVVFVDFIASNIVRLLNDMQKERVYQATEAVDYPTTRLTTQDLYPIYASKSWQ